MAQLINSNSLGKWRKVLLVLVGLHVLAFAWVILSGHCLTDDSMDYLRSAYNYKHYGFFYSGDTNAPLDYSLYTRRTLLYPGIIFLANIKVWVVLLLQNVLSLIVCRLLVLRLRVSVPKPKLWFQALVIVSLFTLVIYANMVMTEVWLCLFLFLGIVILLSREIINRILWLSVLMLMAVLLKPVMLPLAFAFPFLCLIYFRKEEKFWPSILFTLIPALFVGLIIFSNKRNTGLAEYSSISSTNLLNYNAYGLRQKLDRDADAWLDKVYATSMVGIDSVDEITYPIVISRRNEAALDYIKAHPLAYAQMHLAGMARSFIDPGRYDLKVFLLGNQQKSQGFLASSTGEGDGFLDTLKSQNPLLLFLLAALFIARIVVLVLCAVASIRLWKRKQWSMLLTLLFIPIYLAILTGPLGASRFMLPALPILLVLASISLRPQQQDRTV